MSNQGWEPLYKVMLAVYLFLLKGYYLDVGKRQEEEEMEGKREGKKADYILDIDVTERNSLDYVSWMAQTFQRLNAAIKYIKK